MKKTFIVLVFIALGVLLTGAPDSSAYYEYADTGFGGCDNCHGAFQDNRSYISLVDGADWNSDLMDVHSIMVSEDCNACHQPGQDFPVFTNYSGGGSGLDPISCIGCHGRAEDRGTEFDCVDPDNPAMPCGDGAGLRQHHYNASPNFAGQICLSCHADTDPANFTPVDEDVKPPYYTPADDPNYPAKPTDPCNPNGEENFAGTPIGLDNDGDLIYDGNDCFGVNTVPGDCNGDSLVDAGDISALVLEIFDGDGNLPANTPVGTFPGNPVGCDANEDVVVDAGDISCTVLLIFGGPGACGGGAASASAASGEPVYRAAQTEPTLVIPVQVPADAGGTVTVPVTYIASGNAISSMVFSIDFDETSLDFDPATSMFPWPDAISINPLISPFMFSVGITYDPTDTDGELDFNFADISPPLSSLPEGDIVTITFTAANLAATTEAPVAFSQDPPASFGNTAGESVPGVTVDGSVLINVECSPTGTPETVCNGVDDDCDSAIDEDYMSMQTTCGVGECAATGQTTCVDGVEGDTCTPGSPTAEVCDNGLDDDCDGQTDTDIDCQEGVETGCFDGMDDEGDGLIDCADPDCEGVTGGSCSTGNACTTGTRTCQGGAEVCVAVNKPDGTACGNPSDTQCDNPDSCLAGVCVPNFESQTTPCDDGLFCTVGDRCNGAGQCSSGAASPCQPGQTCDEDQDTCNGVPADVDLDIVKFIVDGSKYKNKKEKVKDNAGSNSVSVGKPIRRIQLTVENPHGKCEQSAPATLIGVQDGKEVYNETRPVFDCGSGASRFAFPDYTPVKKGTIEWTVEIFDTDPDDDTATTSTRVR